MTSEGLGEMFEGGDTKLSTLKKGYQIKSTQERPQNNSLLKKGYKTKATLTKKSTFKQKYKYAYMSLL